MEEEKVFVSLQCRDCELDICVFCPNGSYIYGKEGCTRKVDEDIAAEFHYYTEEVIPFWRTYTPQQAKQSYKDYISFLFEKIYSAPIGQKLDRRGKVPVSYK